MRILSLLALLAVIALLGCDTSITGNANENEPPETALSVRAASLVDRLGENDRLTSTLTVAWSGTDRDGYVVAFDFRYFPEEAPITDPEAGWIRTTRLDTTILLPIPPGSSTANVVFEVRAIDNRGEVDPTPARTVFPIKNAPPRLQLSQFDVPPDTSFHVFSFGWRATDPEGPANIARIEVAFNDSLNFTALPPDADFATFVANIDRNDPNQQITTADVYTGRGFLNTGIAVPGLRLNDENTFYIRVADLTDTTSTVQRHTFYVRKPQGEVLYVNDWRKATWPMIQNFHLTLLREFLPAGTQVDVWNLSQPYVTGSAGGTPRSDDFPSTADPTLQRLFAEWKYIYWVTSNSTNTIATNNLPFAAGAMQRFFDNGGKMIVHSPVAIPATEDELQGNPALFLLPINNLISFPDSLRPTLRMPANRVVPAVEPVPGLGQKLPDLRARRLLNDVLPYGTGTNDVPLYEGDFNYLTQRNQQGPWFGPRTIASITSDRRIALFGFNLLNESNGELNYIGADGDPDAPRRAVKMVLEALGFPGDV